jgi:hypothetical protein
MTRTPGQLQSLSDAMISPDGKSLWVHVNTVASRSLDIAIPFAELGDTVQFLVSCAEVGIDHSDQADASEPTGMQMHESAPIEARGIALAAGRAPDESLLVVKLACCRLAFPIAGGDLLRLADDFVRTARTLSAGRGKPN